jgi:hypothetical protein
MDSDKIISGQNIKFAKIDAGDAETFIAIAATRAGEACHQIPAGLLRQIMHEHIKNIIG